MVKACLPLLFHHLHQREESQKSVVIVVTPLTAIMQVIILLHLGIVTRQILSQTQSRLLLCPQVVAAINSSTRAAVKSGIFKEG